MSEYEI